MLFLAVRNAWLKSNTHTHRKTTNLWVLGVLRRVFCQVFTLRGLEKKPTLDVKLSLEDRPESGYGISRPGLSEEEADIVRRLLSRVRLFAATEGLIVKVLSFRTEAAFFNRLGRVTTGRRMI